LPHRSDLISLADLHYQIITVLAGTSIGVVKDCRAINAANKTEWR